jgi:hypothetical protein
MGRKTRNYTFEELRFMLRGRQWTEFKRKRITPNGSKKRKARYLFYNGVWFTAYLETGLAGCSVRVKAKGQVIVFRFLDKALAHDIQYAWDGLLLSQKLGPVVANTDA